MIFGQIIADARKKLGISQKDLADRIKKLPWRTSAPDRNSFHECGSNCSSGLKKFFGTLVQPGICGPCLSGVGFLLLLASSARLASEDARLLPNQRSQNSRGTQYARAWHARNFAD